MRYIIGLNYFVQRVLYFLESKRDDDVTKTMASRPEDTVSAGE